MWFPGYASAVSFGLVTSSTTATLGAGGWLGLTRQGLPPCKKRQACLAHNGLELSCPAEAGKLSPTLRHAGRPSKLQSRPSPPGQLQRGVGPQTRPRSRADLAGWTSHDAFGTSD